MALIQKSVRLPEELIEKIEAQEGDSFTDKLVGVLELYFDEGGPGSRYSTLVSINENLRDSLRHQEEKLKVIKSLAFQIRDIAMN